MGRFARIFTISASFASAAMAAGTLAGCAGSRPTLAPAGSPISVTTVATAAQPSLGVFADPSAANPERTLASPTPSGAPVVLVVRDERAGWLQVLLPTRPNGSTGWVRSSDVNLTQHDFHIHVALGQHKLSVYQGATAVLSAPVAVGAANTPTPTGTFYTIELIRSLDANGAYGPYAYGLSGHSDVLMNFGGGDGELGLHGTNVAASLGHNASHGCIRVANDVIARLAALLPVGVPVDVQP